MSARKHKGRLAVRREAKSRPRSNRLLFSFPLLIFIAVVVFFLFGLTSIGGLGRVSLVSPDGNGNIVFSLFDFKAGTVANIIIPGTTEVNVARSLGTWKLGSVWKLGENEKVGGVLLAETVTKSLRMPSEYWGDSIYSSLSSNDLSKIVHGVFSFAPTNLSLADRLKIGLFSFQAKITDRQQIDLSTSSYLYRAKLADGSLGYKVKDIDLPFDLLAVLADADISKEGSTILFENASGKDYIAAEVGGIVDVLGGKIAAVTKTDAEEIDCIIYGDGKLLTYQAIAKVFSCTKKPKDYLKNFDITIKVGKKFTLRY